jgi:hypothetical protein
MTSNPPSNANFAICKAILNHCNTLFIKSVNDKSIVLPEGWDFPIKSLSLYLYTSIEDLLYYTDGDVGLLKALGFHCPLENQLFMPWFKSPGIQICPVNLETLEMSKPEGGLVRDVPFLFKMVNKSSLKDKLPIFITSDPVDAMLLNASGFLAIGLGSPNVLKGQIRHLAQLQRPLIYLGPTSKKTEQSAELFVYSLEKFCNTFVMFTTDSVREFIVNLEVEPDMALSGVEFIAQRLMHKDNGKTGYERNIEVIEASQKLPTTSQSQFLRYVKLDGGQEYAHFSQSLRFMADLIDAKVGLDQARDITYNKYGTTVFIQSKNQIKLN